VSWEKAWELLSRDPEIYSGLEREVKIDACRCGYRYLEVDIDDIRELEGLETNVVAPVRTWIKSR
jgi:hypothetical protein